MRLKHNKKRNTAFVYEALVRELTESVVKNNKNKQNKIVSIIKDHFGRGSKLNQELELYKTIYETRDMEKSTAEKIVVEVKEKHNSLNKRELFIEQSALINKINKTLSTKVYNNFVPNYKTIASVYSIFQDALPIKDRILLEENIVDQMSSSVVTERETQQPIDSIVYSTFVKKFNEEYSEVLNENQKELMGHYISSFSDNGVEFKTYLNEEIGRLKTKLKKVEKEDDTEMSTKVAKIYEILDNTKNKPVDTETLEIVLQTQELLEEIEDDS
tara:strand:+ start:8591 stop:9406 length:816 start_codon:yes stop_codon:yes gene_type:complete